jgi:excisionase family DNA binding protein
MAGSSSPEPRAERAAPTGLALTITIPADALDQIAHSVTHLLEAGRDHGFLDIDGAAAYLGGSSRKAIYHLVQRGRIRAHRVGGRLLFDPVELREDVERGE